ncbi:MAG: NHL repeat-containing protein [Planctomycetota bacterium]
MRARRPDPPRVLAVVVVACVPLATPAPAAGRTPPFRFGAYERTVEDLRAPSAVAIDGDGRIFVADTVHDRIVVTTRDGDGRRAWGSFGREPGALDAPRGVAVDGGEVFVADTGNHRIQVFDDEGRLLRRWGGRGAEPGLFNAPAGLAVRGDLVCVADTGNDRVQVFDRAGGSVRVIGGPGRDAGRFHGPVAVAFDDRGHLFVADTDNNRIQAFDAEGAPVTAWGDWGPFAGLLNDPRGVVCRDGRVFVTDAGNHRVQVFTPDGEPLYQWGLHAVLPHEGAGKLHYPGGLAIAPAGDFAVVAEGFENRAQVFAVAPADRSEQDTATAWARPPDQTHFGRRLHADGSLLAIPEPELHLVDVFRIDREVPVLVSTFGTRGEGWHQLIRGSGVLLDAGRVEVLVSDSARGRLQLFGLALDPAGPLRFAPYASRLVRAWDLPAFAPAARWPGTTWPVRPDGIARDAAGRLYVVDGRNAMVHVLEPDLGHVASWGEHVLRRPTDIAFDRDDAVAYVVDAGARCVQVFSLAGTLLRRIGEHGRGPGQLVSPFGIAVAGHYLYVTDAGGDRVVRFAEDGTFMREWGSTGTGDGEFFRPTGITAADDDRLFVVDQGNHRAQVFTTNGEWLVTFGTGRASTRSNPRRRP